MYVAFLIVSPVDRGPSLSRYVKAAVGSIKDSGIDHEVTPMGTIIQSNDLDEILSCARKALEAVRAEGSNRISLSIKVDARFDKEISMATKMDSLNR